MLALKLKFKKYFYKIDIDFILVLLGYVLILVIFLIIYKIILEIL